MKDLTNKPKGQDQEMVQLRQQVAELEMALQEQTRRRHSDWNFGRQKPTVAADFFHYIIERKRIEEQARIESAVISGINRILHDALFCEDEEKLGMTCLNVALELTGSQLGFINELKTRDSMDCLALSGLEYESGMPADLKGRRLPRNLRVDGIRGRVLQEGQTITCNDIDSHPDRLPRPVGHPPLTSFIGVPFFENERIMGMIGLGNKVGGYTDMDTYILEKLAPSIVQVLMRKRAEQEIIKARDLLEIQVQERTAQLSQERQRLYNVLETLPASICLLTADYRIPFSNHAFRQRYGETKGRCCYEHIYGRNEPCEGCESLSSLVTGQPACWTFTTPKGAIINACEFPFSDTDGTKMVLQMSFDITRQTKLEAEMARLDRLNLIGQMAAGIGHEIRNPMTAVRGFLQLLGSKPDYADDLSYFELMIEELDRANSIISEFLGMARDKMINLQPSSLNLIINLLYPMIKSEANLREVKVHTELNELAPCLIDRNEIRQMIMNMSRNAMEAMSCRGTLTIGTRQEGNEVVLFIKDQGSGLAPEILDKIGTPFQTTKDNGTGLGLAICYSIANRHKARIDYETGPSGTTFYIRFPAAGNLNGQALPNPTIGPGGEAAQG